MLIFKGMNATFAILLAHKYAFLLPLDVVEGPIATVVAAFLSTLGLMNVFLVYLFAIMGDLLGDTVLYSFGRWGKGFIEKHGYRIGATKERMESARNYFEEHHGRALVASKLLHGVGVTGLVAAGSLHIPFGRYMRTCLYISLLQYIFFTAAGVLFGHAYERIGSYLNYYAAAVTILALTVILFLVIRKLKNRPVK